MRPAKFDTLMHEVLDRRVRPEESAELRALAEDSPACRELLAAQQRLFEGLEADEIPELSAGFAERVVAQVVAAQPVAERVVAKKWRSAWVLELAAVAAVALVVIAGSSYFSPAANDSPIVAELPQESIEQPRPDVPAPQPDAVVYDDIAPPTPNAEANQRYDEIYHAILERLPNRSEQDELLARRPQWVDEVALGLRPVAASFGGAINTLRSTLPASGKSEQPEKPQAGLFHEARERGLA